MVSLSSQVRSCLVARHLRFALRRRYYDPCVIDEFENLTLNNPLKLRSSEAGLGGV